MISTESQKQLFPIIDALKAENEKLTKDAKMLDWLQEIMTNDNNYCEVFFAGLRDFSGKANKFQIESNPEKFTTVQGNNIREIIIEAMKFYPK